jgi:SAM-dependent methyltransferase
MTKPAPGEIRAHNRDAWNRESERGNRWTQPVGREVIAEARAGRWTVLLTESTPVPSNWFPPLAGSDVLCLASGGGQQGPILAAAGARVTVVDNSPAQLAADRLVAQREGLEMTTLEADMADLGALADASFDLVFHPVSNVFVPDVRPVWREAFRVLRPGGVLLAGFLNPALFIFDEDAADRGELRVVHKLPYEEPRDLTPELRVRRIEGREPLEFSHSLTDQIGGQLAAGFLLTALVEDRHAEFLPAQYFPTYIATRAIKPL